MLLLPLSICLIGGILVVRVIFQRLRRVGFTCENVIHSRGVALQTLKVLFPMTCTAGVRILYAFLASNAISPLYCARSDGSNLYIMKSNPSSICYSKEWWSNFSAVMFFIFLYTGILPFTIATIFYIKRNQLEDESFVKSFRTLTSPYKRAFFYWELVSVLKRTSFIFVAQFISINSDSYFARFTILICTISFFAGIEVFCTPYLTNNSNKKNST
jgi:hypothetical protein